MKLPIKITAALLAMVWMGSCKKDRVNSDHGTTCKNGTQYITADVAKLKFIAGTYWQYIDSVSLAVDSLVVDTVITGMSNEPACPASLLEYYTMKTTDYPLNKKESSMLEGLCAFRNTNAFSGYPAFYYDYINSTAGNYVSYSIAKQDSLFVYDRYYMNIVKVTIEQDESEGKDKTVYYSNSAFGVLRKEVYNTSGSLLSKKVLKNKVIVR